MTRRDPPRSRVDSRTRLRLVAVAIGLMGGCRTPPTGVPVLSEGVLAPFVARQKVVAIHGNARTAFDAVLQYDGARLVLLGMTPMGTKAFAVVQTGATFEVTLFVDRPLPAPAEAVLRDVHGAYFDPPQQIRKDGWHRIRTATGGRLHEHWAGGRLVDRVWGSRHDRKATRLRFVGGLAPGEIPMQVEIDHPALELRLEIHTLELIPGS